MTIPNQIEELIDFILDNKDEIDLNDVLVKAELINMRSKARHAGWYFNGKLYRDIDELRGRSMSDSNHPKPLFYYP
jgi:hypothetical protein